MPRQEGGLAGKHTSERRKTIGGYYTSHPTKPRGMDIGSLHAARQHLWLTHPKRDSTRMERLAKAVTMDADYITRR